MENLCSVSDNRHPSTRPRHIPAIQPYVSMMRSRLAGRQPAHTVSSRSLFAIKCHSSHHCHPHAHPLPSSNRSRLPLTEYHHDEALALGRHILRIVQYSQWLAGWSWLLGRILMGLRHSSCIAYKNISCWHIRRML